MKRHQLLIVTVISLCLITACKSDDETIEPKVSNEWKRSSENPVLTDVYAGGGYESASDPHVFYDEQGQLKMIYSGDIEEHSSIKLASGTSFTNWEKLGGILSEPGPSGIDINKETAFYRLSNSGKHQIFYIGYENGDGDSYQAEVFLAEADELAGPYTQYAQPIVPRGIIAGKEVYCITSPSVISHNGLLYMVFLGWNASPSNVSEVWIIGATSADEGHTWDDFQLVDAPIGMEGQITKSPNGEYYAVRTAIYGDKEAIFLAKASHPFGPYEEEKEPILIQAGAPLETDEVIAPQLTFDAISGNPILFYTGANHMTGWWIMVATANG